MLRRAGFIAITVALFCAGTLPVSWAQGVSRHQQGKLRRLKACVGIIPTPGEPQPAAPPGNPYAGAAADPDAVFRQRSPNPNPYLFYVLDQRKDLKPDGWEFYNPAATAFPTAAQVTRWNNAHAPWPAAGTPSGISQTTPLKSDMAAYWEVAISQANYDRLAQMDVIYIPIGRTNGNAPIPTFFTEEQRRILARLADGGVTIWVDWALDAATADGMLGGNQLNTSPLTMTKNNFFTNADFSGAAGTAQAAAGHPLLTQPFNLSAEYSQIGKIYPAGGTAPSTNRVVETRALDMQPTMNLAAVIPTSAGPADSRAYVAAGRYGAGYVVVTAGNVGGAASGPALSGLSGNAVSRVTNQDLNSADAEDVKFAYNLFAWSTEVTKTQKNSRHTGQSSVSVDGLIEQGNYPYLVPVGGTFQTYPPVGVNTLPVNPAAPLVINGVVVAAVRTASGGGGQSELAAFQINPNDDFDSNGFIDDPANAGTPSNNPFIDYSVGQNYDRIDAFNLGAGTVIYGMTVGELYAGAGLGSAAFVFAAGNTGIISVPVPIQGVAMNWSGGGAQIVNAAALGMSISGSPAFTLVPGSVPATTQAKLYAGGIQQPTGFGGNNGRVMGMVVSPGGLPAPEWYYPPRSEANLMGPVAGSLTTAQVMDTGTGAVDTMLLATTVSPNLTGGAGTGRQNEASGSAMGWILASRGDPLAYAVGNPTAGANNPAGGRRFTSARWINIPPGRGVRAPDPREITWDATKYYEVRVMDKARNYVLARFVPGTPGFSVLTNGTAGQVELPEPTGALSVFSLDPSGQDARLRNMWNLNDFVLLADYSLLPSPVDTGLTGEATMRPRFLPPTPYFRANPNAVEPTGVAGGVSVGRDNLVYYATAKGYMVAAEWKQGRAQFRWKVRGLTKDQGAGVSQDVDPTSATYLQDYGFVAAPAAGNRIVFTSRSGTAYVFEPDATIRFKLTNVTNPGLVIPWTPGLAEEVVLAGDHGAGVTSNSRAIMAHQSPFGRAPEQFGVDPDTGTATFQNMENFALDLSTAITPERARAQYGVDTGGRPAVPIQWWFRNLPAGAPAGLPTANSPATALIPIPLVSLYDPSVNPASPSPLETFYSGAVLTQDKIFVQGGSGWLHELPLDPKLLDPNFPRPANVVNLAMSGFNVASPLYGAGLRRLKGVAVGTGLSMAAPAVSQGLLVTNTPRGLTLFNSPSIVISDSNRVVEASGNSTALAATDVVVKHRMDISEFAIPTDPGLANTVVNGVARPVITERLPISRAAMVKKLDRASSLTGLFNSSTITDAPIDGIAGVKELPDWAESSYLVADAGNNRVIEFNPAGKAVWDCTQIYDPMDYIPAGEPLKLSQPMDVQRWVERETVNGQSIYVIHTLIADTGNNRVVEVVDKVQYQNGNYGPNSFVVIPGQVGSDGQPFRWYHVVVWSSQTGAQGMRLRYRTAQRVYWPDANGNRIPLGTVQNAPGVPAMQAAPVPPYLPVERAVTFVMATVQGQQVTYPNPVGYTPNYFRTHNPTNSAVVERRPTVASGTDTIVFLRDKFGVDPGTGNLVYVPAVREAYPMGTPTTADQYRFAQGVVEPCLPYISYIGDETGGGVPPQQTSPPHALNGVSSVQLTVRSDIKFDPTAYFAGGTMPRAPYLLIADGDGVWETRLVPGVANNRMVWAFTADDYAYVTGAGNGDPTLVYSNVGTNQLPGGRRLNAVSARRLASGFVLITSRMPANEQPRGNPMSGEFTHQNIGADVFMLRPTDFRTFTERGGPWIRQAIVTHGWRPDLWVQSDPMYGPNVPNALRGVPSIRWRAAEQLNPAARPTLRTQLEAGGNPAELTGNYIPAQPTYADIAY